MITLAPLYVADNFVTFTSKRENMSLVKSFFICFLLVFINLCLSYAQGERLDQCDHATILERLRQMSTSNVNGNIVQKLHQLTVKVEVRRTLPPYQDQPFTEPCNGFVFPTPNHITTNAHCLTGVSGATIYFSNEKATKVSGISYVGDYQDIAVLKISSSAPIDSVLDVSTKNTSSIVGETVFSWPECSLADTISKSPNFTSDQPTHGLSTIVSQNTVSGANAFEIEPTIAALRGMSGSMILDNELRLFGVFAKAVSYREQGVNGRDSNALQHLRRPAFESMTQLSETNLWDEPLSFSEWNQSETSYAYYLKSLEYVLTPYSNNPNGENFLMIDKQKLLNEALEKYVSKTLPRQLFMSHVDWYMSRFLFEHHNGINTYPKQLKIAIDLVNQAIKNYPTIAKFYEIKGEALHYAQHLNINLYSDQDNRCTNYQKALALDPKNPIYVKTLKNFECS